MNQTKFTFCQCCGKPMQEAERGRPKLYCSDHCGNALKFFHAMQKEVEKIDFGDTEKKVFVAELFRTANEIHTRHNKKKKGA